MLGAIAGDIIGSVYESRPIKSTDFPLFQPASVFTDDTVLTVAVAQAILKKEDYASATKRWGRKYPHAGYGASFIGWLFQEESKPYNSWGNGAAMRVSPVGFAFNSTAEVLKQAERTAEISHNHPEGIKGAQATALAVFMARCAAQKETIRQEIMNRFGYNLQRTVDQIRPHYHFDISCQGSVPEAIIAFLDSSDFEDAIRKAVSLGGDSDTLACICGGIAEAYYREIPETIVAETRKRLPAEFLEIIAAFEAAYPLVKN